MDTKPEENIKGLYVVAALEMKWFGCKFCICWFIGKVMLDICCWLVPGTLLKFSWLRTVCWLLSAKSNWWIGVPHEFPNGWYAAKPVFKMWFELSFSIRPWKSDFRMIIRTWKTHKITIFWIQLLLKNSGFSDWVKKQVI